MDSKCIRVLVGKAPENLNLDSFDFTYSQLGTDYSKGLSLTLRFKQINTPSIPETDITVENMSLTNLKVKIKSGCNLLTKILQASLGR